VTGILVAKLNDTGIKYSFKQGFERYIGSSVLLSDEML